MADEFNSELEERRGGLARTARRVLAVLGMALAVALGLYYPAGMLWITTIDDDPGFKAEAPAGASRAIATAAALVEREVDVHRWVANDPFFLPGAALDNMPTYQTGIVAALARLTQAINEQMARAGGKGRMDQDLDRAVGLLKYPPNVWIFELGSGFGATASSETQYRAARKALIAYNERLAAKRATFDRRPEALLAALETVAADLDTYIAMLDQRIAERAGNLLDFGADDLFYAAKGRVYAYALMLRALGADFDKLLNDRAITPAWARMVDRLGEAAALKPWVVMNGAPDSVLLPSHLAGQAYALMRARARIADVTRALGKPPG